MVSKTYSFSILNPLRFLMLVFFRMLTKRSITDNQTEGLNLDFKNLKLFKFNELLIKLIASLLRLKIT